MKLTLDTTFKNVDEQNATPSPSKRGASTVGRRRLCAASLQNPLTISKGQSKKRGSVTRPRRDSCRGRPIDRVVLARRRRPRPHVTVWAERQSGTITTLWSGVWCSAARSVRPGSPAAGLRRLPPSGLATGRSARGARGIDGGACASLKRRTASGEKRFCRRVTSELGSTARRGCGINGSAPTIRRSLSAG